MITHLRQEGELDPRLRPLFPQMFLLCNLARPDLGLGTSVKAFFRRVGLHGEIIAVWC